MSLDDLGKRTEEWRKNHPLRRWNSTGDLSKAGELGLTPEQYLELLSGRHPTPEEIDRITKRTGITEAQWTKWERSKPH